MKGPYQQAKCCSPSLAEPIVGYFSHDRVTIKVHQKSCPNLHKAADDRLVELSWDEIVAGNEFEPDDDYTTLDDLDWLIMEHHHMYGVDYSLKVARVIFQDKQAVFDSHKKLRALGLLERVEPLIIQYRKGVVNNKWIKHRNHTYYDLTDKGKDYFRHHVAEQDQ